jgi:diguanylate cyclase (GGDEF)-like protein
MIVSIDHEMMLAPINHTIEKAYLALAFVSFVALLGAWFAGEQLIIRPIRLMTNMAHRFGQGDLSARATAQQVPFEFKPLAVAFNTMAAQLAERERDLMATNDRLTVMASIDMVSGLANRRGLQSRLEFEWLKAEQAEKSLALMMIDVDHFKQFNDNYGHPEGDACLGHIGAALSLIANQTNGFAARYGGEEFCLMLPNADRDRTMETAEMVRQAIEQLAVPHALSAYACVTVSVGAAMVMPNACQRPEDLLEAADAALYAAKHRGRNMVVEHGLMDLTVSQISVAS